MDTIVGILAVAVIVLLGLLVWTLLNRLHRLEAEAKTLSSAAGQISAVLSSPRARGQLGERMAEDILQRVGLVEHINYRKQATLAGGSRPDFTFMLPGDRELNMDVKFPFDNYQRFVEAESDTDRDVHKKAFLRDVRDRIKEITGREYINPEGGTLDFVLLLIPNEIVYAFIYEQEAKLFDDSLGMKVVCCSPYMLYGMLALVRQTAEQTALRQASDEVLSLIGRFGAEWDKFASALDTVRRRLDLVSRGFDDISGTRRRALERPLNRIQEIREQRGLPIMPTSPEEQGALPSDDDLGLVANGGEDDDE